MVVNMASFIVSLLLHYTLLDICGTGGIQYREGP